MSINARVRIVDESTGNLIQDLETVTPYLSVNDEIVLSQDGAASITYKVEKLQYIVDVVNRSAEISAPKYSIIGRVDILVSLAP